MARALMSALKSGGHDVTLASELRIYDPDGLPETQTELRGAASREIDRIANIGHLEKWQIWMTYHNYYKAPDLIGPTVARTLNIPYILAEATRAKKRLNGPWAGFAKDAEAACDAAAAILYLTARDAEALHHDAPDGQSLIHLHPFLDRDTLPRASTGNGSMLSVAMMRHGDKLASYQLIADTLCAMPHQDWALDIAGDGPAVDQVKTMMAPFGNNVKFLGAMDSDALAKLYGQASLLFWPGVNEAFGLTYLEAQAAGVPVVAQNRPGVCDVTHGTHPRPHEGTLPLVAAITALLSNPDLRQTRAGQARKFVRENHLRGAATQTLNTVLENVTGPKI
ncbi:MAG: glycosyltransferase involved in cell wall biosynthesis [Ascidiaceihabitans sp.]|jgi:glycosyltransferase involved in cell wall biosynthesis